MLFSSVTISPSVNASSCDDLKIIFARGSGESLNSDNSRAWQQEIDRQLQSSQLSYSFYELGSSVQGGAQYPAVAVSGSTEGFINMLGALVSAGSAYDFGDSVAAGVDELSAYIQNISATCPDTQFILGGYSQGAMVISLALPDLDPNQIVYVATFGDPKLYLPEGAGLPSAACLGQEFSSYRVYVPDCQAYTGILGGQQPYVPQGFTGKVGVWCNQSDIMCSSGWSLSDHTAYVSEQLYYDAAIKIRSAIQSIYPDAWSTKVDSISHDLVLLFDTTISMSNMIESYRAEAKRLAESVYEGGGRVALYEFRDLAYDGEPQLLCDFNCTPEELSQALNQISIGGGGDIPESALSASLTAMNTLKWRPNVHKSIVLLTDSAYLDPDRDGTTLASVVQRSLSIDPVNFYIIVDYYKTADAYAELAQQTGGQIFYTHQSAEATAAILNRPVVFLSATRYEGTVGKEIYFSVSNPDSSLKYDWDLDGDGVFEISDQSSVNHQYLSEFSGYIQVRATDSLGNFSTMSAAVLITASDSPTAQILSVSAEFDSETARISFITSQTSKILVVLDDAILGYLDPTSQSTVTFTDIEPDSILTLIPYNSVGERGNSQRIILSESSAVNSSPASTPSSILSVPLAPNAGVVTPSA